MRSARVSRRGGIIKRTTKGCGKGTGAEVRLEKKSVYFCKLNEIQQVSRPSFIIRNSYKTDKLKARGTNKPTHGHITWAVAAMDSCFALIGAHQHGIAVGPL